MSICRFDDDSDLYIYKSVDGIWSIVVASSKLIVSEEEYTKTMLEIAGCGDYKLLSKELERMHGPIGLGYDGKTFNCSNLDELKRKIRFLKKKGYKVPKDIWQKIDQRKAEEK